MLTKIFIIIMILIILGSLGSALYFLVHDKGKGTRTVKALTWRIALSLTLFLLLLIGFATGILKPHGL